MAEATSAMALTFQGITFDVVDRQDRPWLRSPQIAGALGYDRTDRVLELYARHADEFTDQMTALIEMPTPGGAQEVRIFSMRGANALGFFARTPMAKQFRSWTLDVLEQWMLRHAQPAPALVGQTFERVVAERDTLRAMLAERVLREEPRLRKVIYYYSVPGLTHRERAVLMGWKSHAPFIEALKRLSALGLVDYAPDPRRVDGALKNLVNRTARPPQPQPKRPATYGNRHDEAHMEKMRAGKAAKRAAAKKGGAA